MVLFIFACFSDYRRNLLIKGINSSEFQKTDDSPLTIKYTYSYSYPILFVVLISLYLGTGFTIYWVPEPLNRAKMCLKKSLPPNLFRKQVPAPSLSLVKKSSPLSMIQARAIVSDQKISSKNRTLNTVISEYNCIISQNSVK